MLLMCFGYILHIHCFLVDQCFVFDWTSFIYLIFSKAFQLNIMP
jgi:hypothetical protein